MASLERRLFPDEDRAVMPVVKQLPADWRVEIVRIPGAAFDVRVVIPNVGEHAKTLATGASGDDIVRFLEWVRDNPNPQK